MIDFSCRRCGAVYHADEAHLGKQIRCTASNCGEIVTVAWQDGRYATSGQQIQKETSRASHIVGGEAPNNSSPVRRPANRKLRLALSCGVVLLSLGAVTGYYSNILLHRAKPRPKAVVRLSPRGVEGISSRAIADDSRPSKTDGFADLGFIPSKNEPTAPPSRSPETDEPARSLPTGTRIIPDEATSGEGELESVNGTPLDACVMVVNSRTQKRVREIFVRAGASFLMEHLDPGDYTVVFATGMDWDNEGERFNREPSYFEFGKTLSFTQDETSYERQTITLHTVPHGNVPRRRISEAEFHALSGTP